MKSQNMPKHCLRQPNGIDLHWSLSEASRRGVFCRSRYDRLRTCLSFALHQLCRAMPGWEVQMSAKPGLGNLQALLKLSHFFCCALCLLRGTCSVAECSNHSWAPKVQLVPAEHQGRSVQTKTQLQRYNSPLTAAVSWQNCCWKSAFSWVSCFACRHVHEHSIPQSSTKLALSDSSFSLFSRSAASCELLATCTHRNSGHCRERAFFAGLSMKLTNASGGPLDLLQTNEFYGLASESALHRTF